MEALKNKWTQGSVALFAALLLGSAALPERASAAQCGDLPPALAQAANLQVVSASNLYRVQARPWMQVPTGARLFVKAPAGVTEADMHRAALCTTNPESPLAVTGARLAVKRSGDLYVLEVTAPTRGAALEIQRRASAL